MLLSLNILILLALFLVSHGHHKNGKIVDKVRDYSAGTFVRARRQMQFGISCPRQAARGSDNERSQMILYSPNNREDVSIRYENSGWPENGIKSMLSAGFNTSQQSVIYLHAYTQSARSNWLMSVRKLYDDMFSTIEPNFNLLFFDWSGFSRQYYARAASWVPHLGQILSQFLNDLASRLAYNMSQMHLVSYSLSTHIAGLAGRRMDKSRQLGQITALDPTGVCFHTDTDFSRRYSLRPSDARLVVAKHYDMGNLGARRPIGDVDVFVNGGKKQPRRVSYGRDPLVGVTGRDGSHFRAAQHETVGASDECREVAYACASYKSFNEGQCGDCGVEGNKCYYINSMDSMRLNMTAVEYPRKTRMYIRTGGADQLCIHHYQVRLGLKDNASYKIQQALESGQVKFQFGGSGRARIITVNHKASTSSELDYTSLLLAERRLERSAEVVSTLDDGRLRELMSSIKYLELNYLSHELASERAKMSARFCSDLATSPALVEC